jgi:hypothetical protein
MTKYLILYRSATSAQEQMAGGTPEQAQAGMDAWMAWAGKAGDAIVDLGAPLLDAGHVGPVTGDSRHVTGFSVLQAESADAAVALMDGHPHLQMPDSSIDVLEFAPVPGM